MGFAVPGVCFSDEPKNRGFYGWITDGTVTKRSVLKLNKDYGDRFHKFHLRELKDIRLNRKVIDQLRLVTMTGYFISSEFSRRLLDKLLRYVYAVDEFQRKTNWRMDHVLKLGTIFQILAKSWNRSKDWFKEFLLRRIDGRYVVKRYLMNPELIAKRSQRPDDSEGEVVKEYPGVLTKDGLYWYVGDGTMRNMTNVWKKVMYKTNTKDLKSENHGDHKSILQLLPPEIFIQVMAFSDNLKNMKLVSKYFHTFITLHNEEIVRKHILINYVIRKPLRTKVISESMMALMRNDEDHYITSIQRRLSQNIIEENTENTDYRERFNDLFFKENEFKSTRYRDPNNLTILTTKGLNILNYSLFSTLQVDCILDESLTSEFDNFFSRLKQDNTDEIRKTDINSFFDSNPVPLPYQDSMKAGEEGTLTKEQTFNRLSILTDLIYYRTRFETQSIENGIYLLLTLSSKLDIILPISVFEQFIKCLDEKLHLNELKFYSGNLFILINDISRKYKINIYEPLLKLFYGPHINSDHQFWIYLRDNRAELIGDLLAKEEIQPEIYILNDLASTLV